MATVLTVTTPFGVATHDDTRTCRTGEIGSHGRHDTNTDAGPPA
jgi:hypothetical protein